MDLKLKNDKQQMIEKKGVPKKNNQMKLKITTT